LIKKKKICANSTGRYKKGIGCKGSEKWGKQILFAAGEYDEM